MATYYCGQRVYLIVDMCFRGRIVRQRWVLGGFCRETNEGFLTFVPRRNAITLLPIIVENVAHGSLVLSDMWRSYNNIRRIRTIIGGQFRRRYRHRTVNHRETFIYNIKGIIRIIWLAQLMRGLAFWLCPDTFLFLYHISLFIFIIYGWHPQCPFRGSDRRHLYQPHRGKLDNNFTK